MSERNFELPQDSDGDYGICWKCGDYCPESELLSYGFERVCEDCYG